MSFSETEVEAFQLLFKLSVNGSGVEFYTNGDTSVVYDGDTYIPAAIKADGIGKDNAMQVSDVSLVFQITSSLQEYITVAPAEQAKITIYLYQTSGVIQLFSGQIMDIVLSENYTATITCREEDSLEVRIPQFIIQPGCNHTLFDSNCGLTKTSYKVTLTVTAVSGQSVTIPDISSYGTNYFEGGECVFGTDIRYIVNASGTMLSLQAEFRDLQAGDSIDIYPGCNKRPQNCVSKFSNFIHFLGSPYVPRKNPVLESI